MTTEYRPRRVEVVVDERHFATITVLQPMWRAMNEERIKFELIRKYPKLRGKLIKLIHND